MLSLICPPRPFPSGALPTYSFFLPESNRSVLSRRILAAYSYRSSPFLYSYFVLNSGLIAIAIKAETYLPLFTIWYDNFLWLSLNYFCGASVAVLIVPYTRDIDLKYVGLVLPLLLVLYFTFKTSMGRVEDANKHVEQVHRLYLSTVETLAMAIDAKDQVTHGHIRRVQLYAVKLADAIGVKDKQLVKAIEAAALLHDMGKLAVPERILNKPGKLNTAEFETMKLHASIGADILSSIDFPYPVVPIVRHHHENWNGTGYPHGLQGTTIPIGARILSVADCFDALTSDRPYRPKLSDAEAVSILVSRSGSMYDPLIVDAFIGILPTVKPDIDSGLIQKRTTSQLPSHAQSMSSESLPEHSLAEQLSITDRSNVSTMLDLAATCVGSLVPHAASVFYVHDEQSQSLEPVLTSVSRGPSFTKGKVHVGEGISGWVAANMETIANSESSLDFSEAERESTGHLTWCLSTPIINRNTFGCESGLSTPTTRTCFQDSHKKTMEGFAQMLATVLSTHELPSDAKVETLKTFFQLLVENRRRIG